ncbi:hypothetical protein CHS0354_033329 [Potamilus streckersoni]|uniref:TMC domain-containing protein n=1 Tax=Potamilus streckersoni TaxID=2493646 RepID=A0AAE0RTB3_9BIVA|nr:hypothetical protein CHS0354_033329 [Potamilus streckersoni]
MGKKNRVSPSLKAEEGGISSWDDENPEYQYKEKQEGNNGMRKRRRANSAMEAYMDRRFGNRHVWTPALSERKRNNGQGGSKSSKGSDGGCKMCCFNLNRGWRELTYKLELWKSSLKRIEGHQGTGVVSYFVFLKWLFFLDIFLFILLFVTIVFFQITFSVSDYDEHVKGKGSFLFTTTVADTCTASYKVNVSSDGLQVILDFIQGTGWMERTAMFYGYYSNAEVKLSTSEYNIPLAYFLVTCFALLVSLLLMARNTAKSFGQSVIDQEHKKHKANFCYSVFTVWDYAVNEIEVVILKQKNISIALAADLSEQRYDRKISQRTCADKCGIYTIRFFVNFLIICMLGGAGAAIYYAQDFSSGFTNSSNINNYHSLVKLLIQFLPSLVITLLNAVYPIIFNLLVILEKYRPGFVIKISLIRMVFLKLASLAMLMASLYIEITCSDQNSCRVGQNKCPAIQCWETFVGQAIYKLIVVNFLVQIVFTLLVELPRKLITTKCDCGLAKKIGPAEFDLPASVLDLVYAQTLCWLGLFYAPLIPAIYVLKLFVIFYLKKLSALYNTVPAERPYQASRSNSFFMIVLMVAFFMICIPISYTLVEMTPSPMCGPFRIYNNPKDVFNVAIKNTDYGFQVVWSILTSSAMVAAIIILLILALYYCSALRSGHQEMIALMKEQIVMEAKDKQYLLSRIGEMTGEEKRKPLPLTSQPSSVKQSPAKAISVNEVNVWSSTKQKEQTSYQSKKESPPPYDSKQTTQASFGQADNTSSQPSYEMKDHTKPPVSTNPITTMSEW